MKPLSIFALALIFFISVNVYAQDKAKLAAELATANGTAKQTWNRVMNFNKDMKARIKSSAVKRKYLTSKNLKNLYRDELKIMLEFYKDNFTAEELKTLIKLYSQPPLNKFASGPNVFKSWYQKKYKGKPSPIVQFRSKLKKEQRKK